MERLEGEGCAGAAAALAPYRRRIDGIDDRLVALLAERFALIREVARFKEPRGIPAVIPERIVAVRERAVDAGVARGLRAEFLGALYGLIIDEACRLEAELMAEAKSAR